MTQVGGAAAGEDPFVPLMQDLRACVRAEKNCMLIGGRGVGKTSIILDLAREENLSLAYFSAPTLDPWADFIGVPVPRGDELRFLRPAAVRAAEVLFLDELNRAHPRVQNAVLELVLFGTLNGEPLERLKMVWAAMNPWESGQALYEIDPALNDRFDLYFEVPAAPSPTFFARRFPVAMARCLLEWWDQLTTKQRVIVTPRRLEKIGEAYQQGLPVERVIPPGEPVPLHLLLRALDAQDLVDWGELMQEPMRYLRLVSRDLNFGSRFLAGLRIAGDTELYQLRELILGLPAELRASLRRDQQQTYARLRKSIRVQEGASRLEEYERRYQGGGEPR